MGLPLLNYPAVLGFGGIIESITNIQGEGGQGLTWGIDQIEQAWQGSRQYMNTLRIITNGAYTGPIQIMEELIGCGVVIGAPYVYPIPEFGVNANPASFFPTEQDTGSFVQRVNLVPEAEDGLQWLCHIEYGSYYIWHELGTTNATFCSFLPTDFKPIVRWGTQKYQRYYPTDAFGNPYVNTAGIGLINPPYREESTQTLTIIIWQSEYIEPLFQSYRDTVNLNPFFTFDPYQAKCRDIDGERIYTADYGYVWRVKYEFEMRQVTINYTPQSGGPAVKNVYGWQDLVLNASYYAFGGATGALGPILPILVNGQPVSHPMILNQDGTCTLISPFPNVVGTIPVQNLKGNQALFIPFYNYPYSDFDDFNFPPDMLSTNQ